MTQVASLPDAQGALLDELARRAAEVEERLRAAVGPLSAAQLRWSPPEGGWGVGQVLDHLAISAAGYLERLHRLLDVPAGERGDAAVRWRPSFVGGLLLGALDPASTRRLRSPRGWRVGDDPPPDAALRYLAAHADLRGLIARAAERQVELRRLRLASPISPLLRMNAGDALAVLVVHAERHLAQVERVVAHPAFPRGGPTDGGAPARSPGR